jgi:CobQ-like glutamine amidotransferase family enzyme
LKITIGHLYPELLNLYGDRGNIICLSKRLQWRGIDVQVKEFGLNDDIDFSALDIVFLGGGSDREQYLVCSKLKEIKTDFKEYVKQDGVVIAVCGGFQLLGHYYKLSNDMVEGLSVLDIYTEREKSRLIGNVVIKTDFLDRPVVGFENHAGRTYILQHKPLGTVVYGNGNNAADKKEGVIYKNVIGTYLHGPLLPKNPHLCDYIIKKALERRSGGPVELKELDDTAEIAANEYIVNRFCRT